MNDAHQRRAQERANLISDKTDYRELEKCASEALKAPMLSHRVFWLHKLADVVGEATKGHVPCDFGCSFCCYQPVMMTQVEARYIGRKIGVLPRVPAFTSVPNAAYIGQPCVFLADGKCRIYEHRPFACRVYFSVDDSPQACEIINPKAPGHVAQLDHTQFYAVSARALGEQVNYLADIREFFGKGQE